MELWLLLVIAIPIVFAAAGIGLIVVVTRRQFGRRRESERGER